MSEWYKLLLINIHYLTVNSGLNLCLSVPFQSLVPISAPCCGQNISLSSSFELIHVKVGS